MADNLQSRIHFPELFPNGYELYYILPLIDTILKLQ